MMYFRSFLTAASVLALAFQPILAMPEPTPPPSLSNLEKRDCAADNCLRAIRRNVLTAIPFCRTYTTEPTATIPTWAANCQNNPTRVTSACGCLATAPLKPVYGPADGTNYTIWEQAENILSRPMSWEDMLEFCMGLCGGPSCQSFSLVMADGSRGPGTGLALCYFYSTLFQPDKLQINEGYRRNVVYERV